MNSRRLFLVVVLVACMFPAATRAQAAAKPTAAPSTPANVGPRPATATVKLPVVFPAVNKSSIPASLDVELRARAEKGDVEAMEQLADFLPSPKDFPWYLKAAQGGNLFGMIRVADIYRTGTHEAEKSQALSDQWMDKSLPQMKQALQQKDAKVLGEIVLTLLNTQLPDAHRMVVEYSTASGRAGGFEVDGDFVGSVIQMFPAGAEKIQLLQKCSDDGHLWCATRLGDDYQSGSDGATIDHNRATEVYAKKLQLLQKCSEGGDVQCTANVALDYLSGSEGATLDHARAIEMYTKLAEAGSSFPDDHLYGDKISKYMSPAELAQLYKIAIEHGLIYAAVPLSNAYCGGNGVSKSGPIAIALLQEAMRRTQDGNAWMLFSLAQIYLDGKCFPVNQQLFLHAVNSALTLNAEDRKKFGEFALRWAQQLDGELDLHDPLPQGPSAIELVRNLATSGPPYNGVEETYVRYRANIVLGNLYYAGKLVKQSYPDANVWYQKAETLAIGPANDDFNNDGESENALGNMWYGGLGVAKDYNQALAWYQKSADHGYNWGRYNLANMYFSGTGMPKDLSRSAELYRQAADGGIGDAQNAMGNSYYNGYGVTRDLGEAKSWYEKGAAGGNAWATFNLATMYRSGTGVPKDLARAVELDRTAAESGLSNAQDTVASEYYAGQGVTKDPAQAFLWWSRSAASGDVGGEFAVGYLFTEGIGTEKNETKGFGWIQKAAMQKNASAEYQLGIMLRDGRGTPPDLSAAIEEFRAAAALDDADAELALADLVSSGMGAPANANEAAALYAKAANHGNAKAEFGYGFLLEHGQGVAQDQAAAARYYQAAANQNLGAAENNLGMMFEQGRGVPTDLQRAYQLFQTAGQHGDQAGKQNADQLFAVLQQQKAAADAQAAAQAAEQTAQDAEQARLDKIKQLQDDIETQQADAQRDDDSANQVLNNPNCSGPGAALCQGLGQLGAAKFRKDAAKARNQADADQEEIQQLQGQQVQTHARRDATYGGNLAELNQERPLPTIQDTLQQQQANLYATAAAIQQQKAAQAQADLAASTNQLRATQSTLPASRPSAPNQVASSGGQTAPAGGSAYNPYSSTPTQSGYNPYTGTGTGSIQTKCADVTSTVSSNVEWHSPTGAFCSKELNVYFTDNNTAAVSCTWAYQKDGVWHNYGGGDIQPGQKVGGEWGGDWTCNPDSGVIRYMCFLKSETSVKSCSKQLPSDWK